MEPEDMIVSSVPSKKIKIDFVGQGNETQEKKFSTVQHMQRTVFSLPPFLPLSSPHHPLITSSSPPHHLLITSPARPGALPELSQSVPGLSGRRPGEPNPTPALLHSGEGVRAGRGIPQPPIHKRTLSPDLGGIDTLYPYKWATTNQESGNQTSRLVGIF